MCMPSGFATYSLTLEHMNTRLLQSQGSWSRHGRDLIGSIAPSHTCPVGVPTHRKGVPLLLHSKDLALTLDLCFSPLTLSLPF